MDNKGIVVYVSVHHGYLILWLPISELLVSFYNVAKNEEKDLASLHVRHDIDETLE